MDTIRFHENKQVWVRLSKDPRILGKGSALTHGESFLHALIPNLDARLATCKQAPNYPVSYGRSHADEKDSGLPHGTDSVCYASFAHADSVDSELDAFQTGTADAQGAPPLISARKGTLEERLKRAEGLARAKNGGDHPQKSSGHEPM